MLMCRRWPAAGATMHVRMAEMSVVFGCVWEAAVLHTCRVVPSAQQGWLVSFGV
jgi:hypothetical protein